jgi:hypothetical protein
MPESLEAFLVLSLPASKPYRVLDYPPALKPDTRHLIKPIKRSVANFTRVRQQIS